MAKRSSINIAGEEIKPGETKAVSIGISRLPTRTKIEMPIMVHHAKKDGPVLLLSGGMHGDEINGVETVRRIITNKLFKVDCGTVICIPIVNIYGFLNFSREVPDGKDVNRSFPGSKTGSLASLIAFHLVEEILTVIDYGIDFHTGGARINNYPQIRTLTANPKNLELAEVFSTKFIINSPLRDKSFRKQAEKGGKSILVFEGGESLRLRKNAIDEAINGALRVMKHLGMISEAPPPQYDSVLINSSTWIRASAAGVYHSLVRSGEPIELKQIIGYITGPFGEFEKPIRSNKDGYVLAVNNQPVINKGDALFHVGIE
jgi:hypothetical protein